MEKQHTSSSPMEIRVDGYTPEKWLDFLSQFDDSSIYQTWECGTARWGSKDLSTLVLLRSGKPEAAALVRQIRFPAGLGGIAYVGWGPAWTRREAVPDLYVLREMIRALRQEYAVQRGLFLKITPNIYTDTDHAARRVFQEEGYIWNSRNDHTILVDLSPSLDELRSRLRRKWRQTLAKAERAGLETVEGSGVSMYDEALTIYKQMHVRKQFAEFVDKTKFRMMQELLPEKAKMRILLVRERQETVAALAWSIMGHTGLPLLAATGNRALGSNAAYLMWWKMIEWLKLNKFRFCDLGGIDPEQNPGGFTFKSGIAGEERREYKLLGEFSFCENGISRMVVDGGFGIRNLLRQSRLSWEKIRHSSMVRK